LAYLQALKQSVTFLDFPNGPPRRSLSLGCGVCLLHVESESTTLTVNPTQCGHWVIEAAKVRTAVACSSRLSANRHIGVDQLRIRSS
jgi:hypothetical protein